MSLANSGQVRGMRNRFKLYPLMASVLLGDALYFGFIEEPIVVSSYRLPVSVSAIGIEGSAIWHL